MIERYDIFHLDEGRPIWIECTKTIESLRSRLEDLQTKYSQLMVHDTETDSKLKPPEILSMLNADSLDRH
jgi:hypothetical protein